MALTWRKAAVAFGWLTAAILGVLLSYIAAQVGAYHTSTGEVAPGVAAWKVRAQLPDTTVERIDEGMLCGFPCLVNLMPDRPAYRGSAVLYLTDTDPHQVADALTNAGFQPGDGNLTIPSHQQLHGLKDTPAVDGVPTTWHTKTITDTHGVVVQISQLETSEPNIAFDEAWPPPPLRWAAPTAGLTTATALTTAAIWFHRRRRQKKQAADTTT